MGFETGRAGRWWQTSEPDPVGAADLGIGRGGGATGRAIGRRRSDFGVRRSVFLVTGLAGGLVRGLAIGIASLR